MGRRPKNQQEEQENQKNLESPTAEQPADKTEDQKIILQPQVKEEKKEIVKSKDSEAKAGALLKLKQNINTHYKKELFFQLNDRPKNALTGFSTGSFWMDYAIGGCVPRGRFIMFWGLESSMKTTTALKIMADAQRRDRFTNEYVDLDAIKETHTFDHNSHMYLPHNKKDKTYELNTVAMVDLEGAYDEIWAKQNKVETDKLFYTSPEYGEQAVDIISDLIKSGQIDILLVDSVAMLAPFAETDRSSEKKGMGEQAVLMNKACRIWTMAMNSLPDSSRKPTVILINQEREKIGLFVQKTRVGGKGQGFLTSIEVNTSRGKAVYLDEDNKFPLWQEMKGTVNKNKVAPPKIDYSFNIAVNDYDPEGDEKKIYPIPFKKGDILEHKDVIEYASKYGMMGKFDEGEFKGKYFVKLLGEEKPHVYDKKGDLVNEWIYFNDMNYARVKRDLIMYMTGKV